ncbi:MAG: YicC/YloC family endoribonuclease [Christensenellaceae bacterium]
MTGFGHAVVSKDGRELSIELKSVNHRFWILRSECRARLP